MKNREFYKEEILNFDETKNFCSEFVKPKVLGSYGVDCSNMQNCSYCETLRAIWLEEEYKEIAESPVDWSKIEVDTPILVSNDKENWKERHFAFVKNGKVYVWGCGCSSWTVKKKDDVLNWNYSKLAEKE